MMKGVFCGSGQAAMGAPAVCRAVLELIGKAPGASVVIAYVGAATYDLEGPRVKQTARFAEAGCTITPIDVAFKDVDPADLAKLEPDAIIVSGGNTLFAVDRLVKCGLDKWIREAASKGVVLAGGSAGAIVWFDGGHSDSADPASFKSAMVDGVPASADKAKDWEYIRVPGLGIWPGLVCPHCDKVQSNGVLRSLDFDRMLAKHSGERGLCIDHWAALIFNDDVYRVRPVPDQVGSLVEATGEFKPGEGIPSVWTKDCDDAGVIKTRVVPREGLLTDLLRKATVIAPDERCEDVRKLNSA